MKPLFKYSLLFILLLALAPYFVICFYAFPFADDYCFGWTAAENISFLQKFLNQYLLWNGRYTADVLVNFHLLATGTVITYQFALFLSLLATPMVLWYFINAFSTSADQNPGFVPPIAALFITLFYLSYQPNLTEGVYWFIGICNYHLGNLLLIVQLTLLLKAFSANGTKKVVLHITSFLLLIVSVGFNEIGALLIPLFYLGIFVFNSKQRTANRGLWIAYCAAAFLASAFVFFSPGNFVRANEFENRYNLFYSLSYASLQTIRFLAQWMFNVPFVLLSAVIITNADKIKLRLQYNIDYRLTLGGLLLVVFAGSFLPYFATGILGQHRTINFVFFFFILLWVLFLLSVSERFNMHQKLFPLQNKKAISALLVVSIFMMAITGNGIKMIADFKNDRFKKYKTAFYNRQQTIQQNPYAPIKKFETIPATFTIVDVRSDTAWWVDKCMKKFYIEAKMERR